MKEKFDIFHSNDCSLMQEKAVHNIKSEMFIRDTTRLRLSGNTSHIVNQILFKINIPDSINP